MDSLLKFCICGAGNGEKENRTVFVSNSKKFKIRPEMENSEIL